jgi:hypothetical protein
MAFTPDPTAFTTAEPAPSAPEPAPSTAFGCSFCGDTVEGCLARKGYNRDGWFIRHADDPVAQAERDAERKKKDADATEVMLRMMGRLPWL